MFGHEQVKARDMVLQYTHPSLGPVNCVGHPVKFRCLQALQLPSRAHAPSASAAAPLPASAGTRQCLTSTGLRYTHVWAACRRSSPVTMTIQVLSDWLGFGSAHEQELERDGAFGS